jgi:protocatechuate 3,4-dioxygenase beta subunit
VRAALISIAFVFSLAASSVALACSCAGYPTVCEAYANADAVFVGSVLSVEDKRTKKDDEKDVYVGYQLARVQVEQTFKGMKETIVLFRSERSSCDAVYKEGQRWLFYAYYDKKSKTWSIYGCDRSQQLKGITEDLLYLQALPASAQKTRIAGELKHYEDDPVEGFEPVRNIIGAKVKIVGEKKTYEVFTDKNGIYEIYGLPPGQYSIEPETPLSLRVRFPIVYGDSVYTADRKMKVVLKEKSCAGVHFVYSADTSIGGTIFGADGRPMPRVCLNLMPKDKPAESNWIFDCTDEQGRYEMKDIPPGEYLINVNYHNKISSDEPFPMTYYPGVFEKEKATIVTITAGDHLEDRDIHIPSQEARRVIKGVLLYSDGRPVAEEFVEFKADEVKEGFDGEVHTKTDAEGRFTLNVLQGLRGKLRGFMFTYKGEHVNCPQLEKILREQNALDVGTQPVPLEVNRDVQEMKLVFPFPFCAKAKEN